MIRRARPIAVVGAGIIGAAVAFELRRQGRSVVLIERDEPGKGASFGNMASIAVTEFLPASRPSMWGRMPGWLLDREGPVSIHPAYAPKLLPWFLRFIAASRPSRVAALGEAGALLCQRALSDTQALLEAAGLSSMLSQQGCLCLFADQQEYQDDRDHLELLRRFGFEYDELDGRALSDLEPALSGKLWRALRLPANRSISNPYDLVTRLVERFRAMGGVVEKGEVKGFDVKGDRIETVRLADGRRIEVFAAVLCAGVHTAALAKRLGEPILLETERGYHTQVMAPGLSLSHSLIWPARAFMVTPTAGGVRVGGTVEMAGLKRAPDYRRARVLVRHAQEILPDLQNREASEWMGHRPALPDTIPIISASPITSGVFYATGHGHLGLTLAATTARLMSELVGRRLPALDLAPYRIDRFRR